MGKQAAVAMLLGAFYLRICLAATLNRSTIDESSLLSLKMHINSDILAINWSQETSFCSWIGVTCSPRHPRVTGLSLSNMGLQGTLAQEIGNLSFLGFLDVSNNSINGPILGEIGNLRRLRVLDMSFNQLSSRIPGSLGLLRKLEHLQLSNNYLIGDIPTSMSTCDQLKTLDMSYNNLTGKIPLEFGNLTQLEELSLRTNQFTGELPSTIFNISSLRYILVGENKMFGSIPKDICTQTANLQHLGLFLNQFEGEIPSTLTRCHSLIRLSIGSNKFTGNIPSGFWNLSAIQWISLVFNSFTGTIPPSIANLSNLGVFDIKDNNFHGAIPSEMGQLSHLTSLVLQRNKLSGEVPQSIFNLSRLQILSLAENNLSGNIPFFIDKWLPKIEEIYLGRNQFDGMIPNSISNLSTLNLLQLSSNFFTGIIPISLGNLRQLQILDLSYNQLTNNISNPEQDFISSLKSCEYLTVIQFSANPIFGALPKAIGSSNISASLVRFIAHSCKIISPLPNEMENLRNLLWLNLGYNELTGAIPMIIGRLRNLQKLEINGNKLEGSIIHVLCNLKNMYSLNLAENNFSGGIPRCLGYLSLLREINFANNAFSFNVLSTLWSIERVERVNLSMNFLDGSLSREIGNLKSLIELDLSGNQISGEVPYTISQLHNLITLSLSNNKLSGPILDSFANLKGLQHLDLSRNNFSGPIPKSLEELLYLGYFNVSFNDLSGEIPNKGPFVNFTYEFFKGNKGLCGASRFEVEECKRRIANGSSMKKLLKYILPEIALVVIVVFILILFLRHRRQKILPSLLSNFSFGHVHKRISYHEIRHATCNFAEENLIGRGSFGAVYKGNFPPAMIAAVKVFNLDVQGALRSFDTECQVMRSVRHRNLVKIITSCSSLNFKALVMTYMSNGNLEKWLYSINSSLNFSERLEIIIDVASALEYLHTGYTFPIVHCDLKPSNILLDKEMVAHVSDFGIAKLLSQAQRMQQTRTLGTIGYMAPEYGSEGLISTMVDVYSYGILLMEIFTRKTPTDKMFLEDLTMRKWVSKSFPSAVMEIVDNELFNMDDESSKAEFERCMTSIFLVALKCTSDMPEDRPSMKDDHEKIVKIKLDLSNNSKEQNNKAK